MTPEPERWQQRADEVRQRSFWQPVIDILTPPYRARTIGNLLLLAVCVIGLWAGSTYVPTAMTALAMHAGYSHDATVRLAGISAMTVAAFTIAGCFLVPRIANRFGRRATLAGLFGLMIIGAVGTYGVAYPLQSIAACLSSFPSWDSAAPTSLSSPSGCLSNTPPECAPPPSPLQPRCPAGSPPSAPSSSATAFTPRDR